MIFAKATAVKSIIFFILQQLISLHSGSFFVKIKASFYLSIPISLFSWCVEKITDWTISNQAYIAGVLTCIALDHIIGSIFHALKLRDFTFKKNATGLLMKLSLCAASVMLFEVIGDTIQDVSWAYDYLKTITRLIVILYPAGSAFMNMSALTNGAFPPLGWINKIKAFNEDLDLNRIKSNGQNNP